MEITKEQQKIIDLVKTKEYRNISLAIKLDESQQLGVSDLYRKYYHDNASILLSEPMSDELKERIDVFPLITSVTCDLDGCCLDRCISEKHLYEFLREFGVLFSYPDSIKLDIPNLGIECNDYLKLYEIQSEIHNITSIPMTEIYINVDDYLF